ncbi:LysE family translocator [Halobacillus litoralis]|uniref:LysE family translocator n=1 Tax=Halobacillus litoralis TaxID=45668 RepID=A0A845DSX4_9BACI|nr:LysE family translocator [Halobacillus litoralis]MYL19645.1 LysE family translocator [Halobacillus litoralis]MYL37041.1 LysE family translocator [Halobacillus litoralis]
MEPSVVFSFIGISLLLTLSPGPDILFVLAQSIVQHAKAGIVTALGLCTGLMVHVSAAVFGVSAVIYQSAAAFEIVKYAGAAYLLFLAFQSFTAGESADGPSQGEAEKYHKLYMKGIFMNLLNPKVSLFFLALLPPFVDPSRGSVSLQMLLLGSIFIIQAFLVFFLVSVLSEKIQQNVLHRMSTGKFQKAQGLIFSFIAMQIVISGK